MAHIYLDAQLPLIWLLILGSGVWAIYTADHLMDSRQLGLNAKMYRHRFHAKHFNSLFFLALAAGLGSLVLALIFLDGKAIVAGMVIGAASFLHLALVKVTGKLAIPYILKEVMVAGIYMAGVWILPILFASRPVQWVFPLCFFFAACSNLIAFSYYELDFDKSDRQGSIARQLGPQSSRIASLTLAFLGILGGIISLWSDSYDVLATIILIGICVIQASLMVFQNWFGRNERYRWAGDGAFCLPVIYVLLRFAMLE